MGALSVRPTCRLARDNPCFLMSEPTSGNTASCCEVQYGGRIISFEPVNSAYAQLSSRAAHDPNWITIPAALGSSKGEATINVNRNSDMSSLRTLREDHARPHGFEMVATQPISIVRLDDVFDQYARAGDRVLLKA
jgi:FkbM family methyltransferase